MTYTIWSNGGRYEWILRRQVEGLEDGEIVHRSGLVHRSRGVAFTAMKRWMAANGHGTEVSRG
jgi:hypothetical protein